MTVFFIVLTVIFLLGFIYILTASNILRVREDSISFSNLPESAEGLKIVLISDMHDRNMNDRLLKKLKKISPDIIALCGDIHNRDRKRVPFFRIGRKLVSLCPVYYVRGNHDPFISDKRYYKRLEEIGIRVLEGDFDTLFGIRIYGNGFNCSVPEFYDGFSIHLCHSPLIYDDIEDKAELTLSGHTHGGFIELPKVGGLLKPGEGAGPLRLFSKEAYFPKYFKGVYRKGEKALVVSRGIGFSGVPFRVIPPEINVITLNKLI